MCENLHIVKRSEQEFAHMRQDVGRRLREERERLTLNQVDFGQVGGVSRRTQVAYEAGDGASPDAEYLARIASAGVDVLYVLTGAKRPGAKPGDAASIHAAVPTESDVLEHFRRLSATDQALVAQLVHSLARNA